MADLKLPEKPRRFPVRVSGEASSFKDKDVSGIGGSFRTDVDITPELALGLTTTGYRVNTPVGKFSDMDNPAARLESKLGKGTVRFDKPLKGKGGTLSYEYPFAKGGSVRGAGCAVRGVKKCKMR